MPGFPVRSSLYAAIGSCVYLQRCASGGSEGRATLTDVGADGTCRLELNDATALIEAETWQLHLPIAAISVAGDGRTGDANTRETIAVVPVDIPGQKRNLETELANANRKIARLEAEIRTKSEEANRLHTTAQSELQTAALDISKLQNENVAQVHSITGLEKHVTALMNRVYDLTTGTEQLRRTITDKDNEAAEQEAAQQRLRREVTESKFRYDELCQMLNDVPELVKPPVPSLFKPAVLSLN